MGIGVVALNGSVIKKLWNYLYKWCTGNTGIYKAQGGNNGKKPEVYGSEQQCFKPRPQIQVKIETIIYHHLEQQMRLLRKDDRSINT